MTLDSEAFDAEADELDDEVGGPGNRIVAGRAKKVTEFLARQLVDDPDGVEVEVVEGREREAKLVVRASQAQLVASPPVMFCPLPQPPASKTSRRPLAL